MKPLREIVELPVNNYLKSPEEIDAEFHFIAASDKQSILEMEVPFATYGRVKKLAEVGGRYFRELELLSGALEENY